MHRFFHSIYFSDPVTIFPWGQRVPLQKCLSRYHSASDIGESVAFLHYLPFKRKQLPNSTI